MGQAESNESAAVKRQAEGGAVPMYQLLDLSGGGVLLPIASKCMVKKDWRELDEAIKQKVTPYLYNGGKGAMIPIAQMVMIRNRDRPPRKFLWPIKELGEEAAFSFVFEGSELLSRVTEGWDPVKSPHLFREVCWKVEERGFVGESAFHICFLMGTKAHLNIGRRMLNFYPKLINDIYMSEEYYGENVLHMSAVAEDPTMVKYLLEQGVDIHERAYGNFFCPEDQKPSRNDSLEHEEVDVCLETNYDGFCYWGEYPLNFAAVLSQEECYRLILNKGANHDLQDTNGCTVTHIMVVYDLMKMFDIAVELGAAINILNNQQLTPLSTASFLARTEMFFHIANIEREVYWQIGNVTCSAYPIEQLDSINSKTGELNVVSALNLIVFGDKIEHLDLIEGIIVDILYTKWQSFIKKNFFRQAFTFFGYFCLAMFVYVVRPEGFKYELCKNGTLIEDGSGLCMTYPENATLDTVDQSTAPLTFLDLTSQTVSPLEDNQVTLGLNDATVPMMLFNSSMNGTICRCEDSPLVYKDMCYLHTYDSLVHQARGMIEVVLIIWSIVYLGIAAKEATFNPREIYIQSMSLCPSRILFLLACILMQFTVPLRLTCMAPQENSLAIIIMYLIPFYFLFFCRGFKTTGPFVTMIYRMMAADVLRFCIIYFIFIMGFSQSYYICFQSYVKDEGDDGEDNPMESPVESIITNFIMSLGGFGGPWGLLELTDHTMSGRMLCVIFLLLVYLLLVNLLIAMMGDTYGQVAEIKNEWMRQWARVVLLVERGIAPGQRLIEQNRYSEYMATGEKALILKQVMSPEKLQEIEDIIEMKVSHRRNIIKRKAKFGYESTSTIGANLVLGPSQDDEDV